LACVAAIKKEDGGILRNRRRREKRIRSGRADGDQTGKKGWALPCIYRAEKKGTTVRRVEEKKRRRGFLLRPKWERLALGTGEREGTGSRREGGNWRSHLDRWKGERREELAAEPKEKVNRKKNKRKKQRR